MGAYYTGRFDAFAGMATYAYYGHLKNPKNLYAFGGPDATHVTQLFPDADEYILIGQETPGSQQSALRLLESVPNMYLLIDCMRSFFKRGYFITHDMAQQLSTKKAIGVAPLILAQLSRLGFKIIALQNFF